MTERERYTLESFQAKYKLPETEALRLFHTFGPDVINLNALMNAKLRRETDGPVTLDQYWEFPLATR